MLRVVSLLALIAPLVSAQTSSGSLGGTVFDPSGAVIPGAQVRLLGTETGDLVRTLTTDGSGLFIAPLLRPLNYTIEVSAQGFKTLKRSGVILRVDDQLTLRLTLEPGATAESINVTAAAELLEEKSNTVGQVVDERTMQQLPLNGRNYLQLGSLAAGAVPSRSRDRTISAYGNRGLQNAFLLDGARNQSYLRGLDNRQRDAMRPQLEAIAEFKVQTSNYSAEYGASAGSVINVVTKSGSNEIHGSAFEFLRNNAMDARDYFLPASAKQPLYVQHQFGGSLGGWFIKNRAWWQAAYQRTHISEGETNTATVPQAAERGGLFAAASPIYDPATLAAGARTVFPDNRIPVSRFDRVGKRLLDLYPEPNLPLPARNYVSNPLQATRSNNLTTRGDLRVSDQDSVFFRFSLDDGAFDRLPVLPLGAQTGTNRETPAHSYGVGYTRIINPTVINEARLAYNSIAVNQDGTQPKDEIVAGSLDSKVSSSIPTFGPTGYATLGDQPAGFTNVPLYKKSKVWNLSDNLSMVRGKHTWKMGADFQIIDVPTFATLNGRGSFGFSGVFTQNPQRRPGSGSSIADLLLGLPNTITTGTPSDANERANNYYFYAQDDWQATKTLTLNLGVRYEMTKPFYDKNNRLANMVLDSGPLYGQYVLAGDSRLPRSLMTVDKNNVAPRLGFAWRTPVPGMVVRGGAGVFFAQDEAFGVSQRITNNPPFVGFGGFNLVSDQLNLSSTIPLSGALPSRPAAADPAAYKFDPRSTLQIRSWPTRFTIPYVAQWNLSVQKDLGKSMVWEVNYVGNRGTGLWGAYEGNQPFPGAGGINTRRPLQALSAASILRVEPWVRATYHGVSTRLERRLANGLNFLFVYTFGRALDNQSNIDLCQNCVNSNGANSVPDTRNRRTSYGLADHHIAHRFVLSGRYELPFHAKGLADQLVRGWAISGISTIQSGEPITPNLNFDNANTGTVNWPNRLRKGTLDNPSIDRWFDTSAFVFPAQYTFGNAGRNVLTGPGFYSTDASVSRDFRLPFNERSRVEFRAEGFNVFNTPQLAAPGATLGNPNFGVVGATARSNRQLQMGLRVIF